MPGYKEDFVKNFDEAFEAGKAKRDAIIRNSFMKITVTASEDLRQWIAENGNVLDLSVEDIVDNRYIETEGDLTDFIIKISLFHNCVVSANSKKAFVEIYNSNRE
jgi:hypothetical protein